MKLVIQSKRNRDISTEIVPPLLLEPTYGFISEAENQKRSAKGSNFKEDDRALPL